MEKERRKKKKQRAERETIGGVFTGSQRKKGRGVRSK